MESAQNSHLEKANGKMEHSQELCVSKNKSKALIDPHLFNDKFIWILPRIPDSHTRIDVKMELMHAQCTFEIALAVGCVCVSALNME